jgi:predicted nucleic acid-binding protein
VVAVADTSPINYLVLVGQIELLSRLYKQILIPPAVLTERRHPAAPKPVQDWAHNTPKWLQVASPAERLNLPDLDPGENEAIALQSRFMPDFC